VNWQQSTLGELCKLYQPETITKKEMKPDGKYPVFGANGVMGRYHRFNHAEPQLVVGCRGACGTVHITQPESWITGNSMVVQPKDDTVDLQFLRYFFEGPADLGDVITGAAQPQITQGSLKPIIVPLPPLDEQKRIVAVLDNAFAALDRALANVEANLLDAAAVRDQFLDKRLASLAETFGLISIGDIASVKGGKRLPKGQKTSPIETAYPYISVRDMTDQGTVDIDRVQYISQQSFDAISRYVISKDDIYVSIAGTIAKTGVIPAELDGANLTENAAKLVLKDGWLRDYVYWCTRSSSFKEQAIEQTRTAAQPKLALQRLAAIRIPAADSDGQAALCEAVAALRQSVIQIDEAFRSKLGDIADLRQSLLQKAFAGELS
jgi:type I restriction enzyme S subunit